MAHSPSHRSAQSVALSSNNLLPPTQRQPQQQQRRMTSPSPASSSSLRLPEGAQRPHANTHAQSSRPPSPLRNGFIPDTSTGIHPDDVFDDDDDDDQDDEDEDDDQDDGRANRFTQHKRWSERSASPSSSMSQLAATLAQRVGSFVGGISGSASGGSGTAVPRSPGARSTASTLPSDAELEAEAEREREKSRREAEKILTREAQERKALEGRVLAMMENARALPPPPSRSYSLPNPPGSPSASTKEREKEAGGWWAAAKNRLTPTKEKDSLTPAQQVILDAKARDKDKGKKKDRKDEREKDKDGAAALANLNIPVAPPQRKPPPSPSSPTPSRPQAPNLSPSPMRSTEGSSPSREAPPLYAQFTPQGTLDVPGTLLTIVKRFEKLEKWTVGHVRALEERMSDVERWLVDKEKVKEKDEPKSDGAETLEREVKEIKAGFAELQGRITELGREVAKMATAPTNLASGPERQPASVSVAPQASSSFAVHEDSAVPSPLPTPAPRPPLPQPPTSSSSASASPSSSAISGPMTPHTSRYFSATARESTSPPLSTSRMSSGTRLPYPTGDYASPPDAPFSPPTSPPSSLSSATRTRPMSIAGLPSAGAGAGAGAAGFGIGLGLGLGLGLGVTSKSSSQSLASTSRVVSPSLPVAQQQQTVATAAVAAALPPPKPSGKRTSSVSPTPRKRYTVALGEPIVGVPSPSSDLADEPDEFQDETIRAKPRDASASASSASASSRISAVAAVALIGEEASGIRRDGDVGNGNGNGQEMAIKSSSPSPSPLSISKRRLRAQSAYGLSSLLPPTTPTTPTTMMTTTPLRPRIRSRSIDPERDRRLGAGAGEESGTGGAGVASNGGNGAGGPAVFAGTGRFVDPLVLRRQDRESSKIIMPKPIGKVPIEQLVAFFDGERRSERN